MSEAELKAARARIDQLDSEIQSLISERARIAQEIARIKQKLGGNGDYYRPAREAEVLRRVIERNQGPLSNETLARLIREIMSACLSLESPLTVAYLGPEGTYTQAAVYKHFGHFVTARPLAAIDEIFREVEAGNAEYGVVPVENSNEGVVNHTLDLFVSSPLKVSGEVALPVHHHLLSQAESLSSVKRVYAHAQSLAQCRKWLDGKLPNVVRVAVSSNAEGARMVKDEPDAAAIAGRANAELYGLGILAANIEDEPDNTTRFLVIGQQNVPPTGNDMTSLLLSVHNRPGALHDLLAPFAEAGVNLTRIESRPSRRAKWDYNFFVDIEGHIEDPAVQSVLARIQQDAAFFKVLGSYPRTVI
jgi:chorismate mutase/prephenate dehydratase